MPERPQRARIGDPHALARGGDHCLLILVVLILDIADNRFHQVFQAEESGHSAIFVADDGDVPALAEELVEQAQAVGARRLERDISQGAPIFPTKFFAAF